jgi:putative acetyltransferase
MYNGQFIIVINIQCESTNFKNEPYQKVNPMKLRKAQYSDLNEMQELYVKTIKSVCSRDYNEEQIEVWTSSVENTERWKDVLENQVVLVAEKNNQIVGYGTLDKGNYIDFFYVHKDFQGQRIASAILSQVETEARKTGSIKLTSDVSITAKPFFEKNGFKVLQEQKNILKGIELINFKMEKLL